MLARADQDNGLFITASLRSDTVPGMPEACLVNHCCATLPSQPGTCTSLILHSDGLGLVPIVTQSTHF